MNHQNNETRLSEKKNHMEACHNDIVMIRKVTHREREKFQSHFNE